MRITWRRTLLAFVATAAITGGAFAQDEEPKETPSYTEPPELTTVTGYLMQDENTTASGGLAYFIFQSRLNEIPHENPMEKVNAMAEKVVPVTEEGRVEARMAPGNYALIYEPQADNEQVPGPGPESMAVAKRMSREQMQRRIEAIKQNAQQGLPVVDGKLGDSFVIENRFVRPPIVDFGAMVVQSDDVVQITANKEDGGVIDFPVALRLRGKNGDILEPHTPSVSEQGVYTFYDVFPQSYQVFALGTKPKPGMGDDITTPTVENDTLVFDGTAVEHTVIVKPGKPGGSANQDAPPPTPPPAGAGRNE